MYILQETPAHVNDGDMGPVIMEKVASPKSTTKLEYVIMDAGYDQVKNYEAARKYNAQAIIPLNLRNEKERLQDFHPMGHPVVPWGMIWSTGVTKVIT